jgi:hypothetical protein
VPTVCTHQYREVTQYQATNNTSPSLSAVDKMVSVAVTAVSSRSPDPFGYRIPRVAEFSGSSGRGQFSNRPLAIHGSTHCSKSSSSRPDQGPCLATGSQTRRTWMKTFLIGRIGTERAAKMYVDLVTSVTLREQLFHSPTSRQNVPPFCLVNISLCMSSFVSACSWKVQWFSNGLINDTIEIPTTRYRSMASFMFCSSMVENGPFL